MEQLDDTRDAAAIISVQGLIHSYDSEVVLHNLSLSILVLNICT